MLPHDCSELPLLLFTVLLKLLDATIVGLHLLPQNSVLQFGSLFIKLQTPRAIQAFEIKIAFPPDTDSIEDKWRPYVDLEM